MRIAADRAASGDRGGSLRRGDDGGSRRPSALLFADGRNVDVAVGSDGEGRDFALGGFVEDEAIGGGGVFVFRRVVDAAFGSGTSHANNAPARLRSGEQIAVGVEVEDADVSFVAVVEELAFAVRCDGKNLAFVSGSDVKSAVGGESEIPDIFCFGIEEDGFFAGSRDAIDLAVGRGGDVQGAFGVESDGLHGKIGGFEKGHGLAVGVEAKHLCGGATGSVERALGADAHRPQIGSVGIGEQSKSWRKLEAAVAADGDAVRVALEKFFVGGLPPIAGVLGERKGREEQQAKKADEVKDA